MEQSSMHRPSPPAGQASGREGLAKLALDCAFADHSDFTEAIRSNSIHSLHGRMYACNSEVVSSFRVSVYTWVYTPG